MATQNYENHARFVPMYHFVLSALLVLTFGGSITNLYLSWGDHSRIYSASLIVVLSFCALLLWVFCRVFPLKAQDRAIRAEENLRHFVLTGKLLDPKITIQQTIALRFAPDGEFVALAQRAAKENLAPKAIKQAIKNWKPDTYRV
jgi:hypothetical protein